MRVGVLADTHLQDEDAARLAPLLRQVWGDIDLTLHAGDVTSPLVIEALGALAPTLVVAGNMDGRESWPRVLIAPVGRYRVGLTHGDFMRVVPATLPPLWRRSGRFDKPALHAYLRAQFDQVQAIVFGHTHHPHCQREGGVLFFNPGAFHGQAGRLGSVGLLTADEQGLRAEVISLADYCWD